MHAKHPLARLPRAWRGKALARVSLLLVVGALVAALAAAFGIARDYGYLQASILTGSAGGQYHALATRLAGRAAREHGSLTVLATAGSIENVQRLVAGGGGCAEMFALIQDGAPVPAGARLELLGRLPEPESLLLLGRTGSAFANVADLRGAAIGIGPDGSGTAHLMKQLFADADLRKLGVRLSHHDLSEQARLVAESKLDLANANDSPTLVSKNRKVTGGVYDSLTKNLTLLAEVTDVKADAHNGNSNKSINFNVGAFLSF